MNLSCPKIDVSSIIFFHFLSLKANVIFKQSVTSHVLAFEAHNTNNWRVGHSEGYCIDCLNVLSLLMKKHVINKKNVLNNLI